MLGIPADASDIEIVVGRTDGAVDDIAKRAARAAATIVGRSGPGRLGPSLGRSTAFGTALCVSVPVLAVDPRTKGLPRVAVVGTNFGQASGAAARAALECLGPTGVLHLRMFASHSPNCHGRALCGRGLRSGAR